MGKLPAKQLSLSVCSDEEIMQAFKTMPCSRVSAAGRSCACLKGLRVACALRFEPGRWMLYCPAIKRLQSRPSTWRLYASSQQSVSAADAEYCHAADLALQTSPHDWTLCFFHHTSERARRRDLHKHAYSAMMCPEMLHKNSCSAGALSLALR
jgi:hypothetical protein